MLSINTNLSSLIVQNNLTKSTNALNQAIERMTTGFKINHASDNAAGYSIAQNMSSQLSSYSVAQDNIASGMDMVATAQDTISLMQSHGERIHALITQARNGTYGEQSLAAIQSEVDARLAEINRLYRSTEYNGIQLFDVIPDSASDIAANAGKRAADATGNFLAAVVEVTPDVIVESAADLEDAINNNSVIGIANADVLAELAKIVNGEDGYTANNCAGKTITLTNDIDLSAYQDGEGWTKIGRTRELAFRGTFDGQGHIVENLKIDKLATSGQGLFGNVENGALKNVGLVNVEVTGNWNVGSLAGIAYNTSFTNCYSTGGSVHAERRAGGLVGTTYETACPITNCYSSVNVFADTMEAGGLIGQACGNITNCYATGDVKVNGYQAGGLAGYTGSITNIINSYATGNVSGNDVVGGLVGIINNPVNRSITIENSYSTGTVSGESNTGSFIGRISDTMDGSSFGTITISNTLAREQGIPAICSEGSYEGVDYSSGQMEGWLANIQQVKASTTLQVGINSDCSSQISFDTTFSCNLNYLDVTSQDAYYRINSFLNSLSERATQLGAVSNRLESALDSTSVAIENLTSSRSTLRDSDIAKESSSYIKSQILQQAAATLLATANQTPSIALQLL